jgi:hypothetical protein
LSESLQDPDRFQALLDQLYRKMWVVYGVTTEDAGFQTT